MTIKKVLGILCASLAMPILSAQTPLIIPKIEIEPRLDGNLSEPVWDALDAIPLVMLNPNAGSKPSERSEFKIACTDKYLFFAAFNYDSEPEKIQSTSKRRDDLELNNDWCGLMIDSYNDKENALDFSTTPVGLRLDMQLINDGVGDFPANADWNVIWDVETKKTNEGWFAEFRIPLSSLRYQEIDGKVTVGLGVFRYIARKSEWILELGQGFPLPGGYPSFHWNDQSVVFFTLHPGRIPAKFRVE